ncbi:MAG TPA: hypothetical protein ENG89_01890, partial [Candidatus Moranbacteria bacterium]|nr:hypothetical protein [Candidatus Moranbacteria bacterium]
MVKISKKHAGKTKYSKEKKLETKRVIKKMHRESEEEIAAAVAIRNNLPYLDLGLIPVGEDDVKIISERDSHDYNMAVFHKTGKNVKVAIINPQDVKLKERIEKLREEKGWDISLYVVSQSSIQKVWDIYKGAPLMENLDTIRLSLSGKDLEEFEKKFGDLLSLKERIKEIPITKVLNTVMAGSVKMDASDVHFEPQEKDVRVRFRIDGILQDVGNIPSDTYRSILSRIKMMSGMKINIRDIAQDGHFSININRDRKDSKDKSSDDARFDVRVNVIPGNFGESTVMRLLNQSDVMLNVEDLGLRGLAYEEIKKQTERPNGIILATGPTGSGKTTTLYALINKLNVPGVKVITIEDPIEYQIKGISQTQVSKNKDYTFAKGLRAIVRQDPDIILVGEVRDDETADIAINAALTGHLVLSTLHTNNASASIPRLIEMGVKPSLIPPAVNAFIAQRLVRRLCPHCKKEYKPAKETVISIKKILAIISPKSKIEIPKEIPSLYRPIGCSRCHNLGYKGRVGIFEVLTINEEIEKLVMEMAGETDITRAALENGMVTMAQDGILKAAEGITSMEEVWRVTGQTEFLEELYEKLMAQALGRATLVDKINFEKAKNSFKDFKKFQEVISAAKTKDLSKIIFSAATLMDVGDIHIEPEANDVKVRFRIDGILHTVATFPLNEYPNVLGEIKLLSGVKSGAREGVIDSRFSIKFDDDIQNIKEKSVDIRVSIILGGHGETVVLRLLSKATVELDMSKLGFRKQNLDKILKEIEKPNGIILNTGPTGSGKTTTLYALLKILNKPEVKIITVGDPIEYQIEGILQTAVTEKEGYSFSDALRALLRQNPDILMIGEIRDEETAKTAVQAALTGHLVLSTIHTNNAAGSVQRMINLG